MVIQVLLSSIEFESKHVHTTFPKGATMRYDFSLILAWIVFLCNLFAGCAFIVFSRKRKRDKAPTEEIAMADEPTIIGRWFVFDYFLIIDKFVVRYWRLSPVRDSWSEFDESKRRERTTYRAQARSCMCVKKTF